MEWRRTPAPTAGSVVSAPTRFRPEPEVQDVVRVSSFVIAFGAALFVVPVPGTFITGGATMIAGLVARRYGY